MTCSQHHVLQIPIFWVFEVRVYLTVQTIKSTFGSLCSCTDRLFYFTVEFKVHRKDPLMEVLLMSYLLARGFVGLNVRLSAICTVLGIQTHFRKWRRINTCAAIAEWHHYQKRQRGHSFEASFTLAHERRVHVIWMRPEVRKNEFAGTMQFIYIVRVILSVAFHVLNTWRIPSLDVLGEFYISDSSQLSSSLVI